MEKNQEGITAKREENFSEWFTQIVQKTELADLRYNVKGFLVFQPWSVLSMEKMYEHMEKNLQNKGHEPYFFPTLIPEENLKKESSHIGGFTPEVFWVTHGGEKKFEERLALRPTSETAFYEMFGLWIRSYKDLPFKTYQRAQVFRYETKATRPFLDKFPGASRTFAADALNPNGKVIQLPSTHMISPEFSKAFNVKFMDKDESEKYAHITCYGPAISRIFASVIIVHGDDKGLKFPWDIAPVQVMIVPITDDKRIIKKAKDLKKQIEKFASVRIDLSDKRPGEKFNHWEMKGIPIRIDIGLKDLENKNITLFRRDLDKKVVVSEDKVIKEIKTVAKEFTKNLIKKADRIFEGRIKDAKNLQEIKEATEEGFIARCNFCSVDKEGISCAKMIETETGAEVRGTMLDEKNKATGKCSICKKEAKHIVYIAKSY